MTRPPKLSEHQLNRLRDLEPRLKACVVTADLETAKGLAAQIQKLLLATGHRTRWMMNQNWLCECALEAGDAPFAIHRLEGVRQCVTSETRTYLEATTLLAIAYVREGMIEKAKPLITFVLGNSKNITSERRRQQFHKRFVLRIEEEGILAFFREEHGVDLDPDRVQKEAIKLLSVDEVGLLHQLGRCLDGNGIRLLAEIREHSWKALPLEERKLLPGPAQATSISSAGERMRQALRRVTWRALCDPNDEINQAWTKGLSVVYDKKWIASAVIAACKSWQITATMIVTTLVAFAFKVGANAFCEAFAPQGIMISLNEKD